MPSKVHQPPSLSLKDCQKQIYDLEKAKGWLGADLITNCFYMTEEIGELCRAVRKHEKMGFDPNKPPSDDTVAEELVDIFNYICAIANRLDIDLSEAFSEKMALNHKRKWVPLEK